MSEQTVGFIIKVSLWIILLLSAIVFWFYFLKQPVRKEGSFFKRVVENIESNKLLAGFIFVFFCLGAVGTVLNSLETIENFMSRLKPEVILEELPTGPLKADLNLGDETKDLVLGGEILTHGFDVRIRAKNLIIDSTKGFTIVSHPPASYPAIPKAEKGPNGVSGGNGSGDNGRPGLPGKPGQTGSSGTPGGSIHLDISGEIRGRLKIVNHGLDGQQGGEGGDGGNGGTGGKGKPSSSGVGFGGVGNCEKGPGRGGDGGQGGNGGTGGNGGDGGDGGQVFLSFGTLKNATLEIVALGGKGGHPGEPGLNGQGGAAGPEGNTSKYCNSAGRNGRRGQDGSQGLPGTKGQEGQPGTIKLFRLISKDQVQRVKVEASLTVTADSLKNLPWENVPEDEREGQR
jgi:hypothetical protein